MQVSRSIQPGYLTSWMFLAQFKFPAKTQGTYSSAPRRMYTIAPCLKIKTNKENMSEDETLFLQVLKETLQRL